MNVAAYMFLGMHESATIFTASSVFTQSFESVATSIQGANSQSNQVLYISVHPRRSAVVPRMSAQGLYLKRLHGVSASCYMQKVVLNEN